MTSPMETEHSILSELSLINKSNGRNGFAINCKNISSYTEWKKSIRLIEKLILLTVKMRYTTNQISSSNWFVWVLDAPSKCGSVVAWTTLCSHPARWTYCFWRHQSHYLFYLRHLPSTKSSFSCYLALEQHKHFSSRWRTQLPARSDHLHKTCLLFQLADCTLRRWPDSLWTVFPSRFPATIRGALIHSSKVSLIDPVKPRV